MASAITPRPPARRSAAGRSSLTLFLLAIAFIVLGIFVVYTITRQKQASRARAHAAARLVADSLAKESARQRQEQADSLFRTMTSDALHNVPDSTITRLLKFNATDSSAATGRDLLRAERERRRDSAMTAAAAARIADSVYTAQRIAAGARIHSRIVGKYPFAKPFLFGFADPALAWFLPDVEWQGLSHTERAALVAFMPTLVAQARANPEPVADLPSSAPLFKAMVARVRSLSPGQWVIGVGSITRSGGETTLTIDDTVVCGSNAGRDCTGQSAASILAEARSRPDSQ